MTEKFAMAGLALPLRVRRRRSGAAFGSFFETRKKAETGVGSPRMDVASPVEEHASGADSEAAPSETDKQAAAAEEPRTEGVADPLSSVDRAAEAQRPPVRSIGSVGLPRVASEPAAEVASDSLGRSEALSLRSSPPRKVGSLTESGAPAPIAPVEAPPKPEELRIEAVTTEVVESPQVRWQRMLARVERWVDAPEDEATRIDGPSTEVAAPGEAEQETLEPRSSVRTVPVGTPRERVEGTSVAAISPPPGRPEHLAQIAGAAASVPSLAGPSTGLKAKDPFQPVQREMAVVRQVISEASQARQAPTPTVRVGRIEIIVEGEKRAVDSVKPAPPRSGVPRSGGPAPMRNPWFGRNLRLD